MGQRSTTRRAPPWTSARDLAQDLEPSPGSNLCLGCERGAQPRRYFMPTTNMTSSTATPTCGSMRETPRTKRNGCNAMHAPHRLASSATDPGGGHCALLDPVWPTRPPAALQEELQRMQPTIRAPTTATATTSSRQLKFRTHPPAQSVAAGGGRTVKSARQLVQVAPAAIAAVSRPCARQSRSTTINASRMSLRAARRIHPSVGHLVRTVRKTTRGL